MEIVLDARRMGREQVHAYLKEVFPFPPYYGNNLDALYDCLTDLPETNVIIMHTCGAQEFFWKVYRVFLAAARENPHLTIQMREE